MRWVKHGGISFCFTVAWKGLCPSFSFDRAQCCLGQKVLERKPTYVLKGFATATLLLAKPIEKRGMARTRAKRPATKEPKLEASAGELRLGLVLKSGGPSDGPAYSCIHKLIMAKGG